MERVHSGWLTKSPPEWRVGGILKWFRSVSGYYLSLLGHRPENIKGVRPPWLIEAPKRWGLGLRPLLRTMGYGEPQPLSVFCFYGAMKCLAWHKMHEVGNFRSFASEFLLYWGVRGRVSPKAKILRGLEPYGPTKSATYALRLFMYSFRFCLSVRRLWVGLLGKVNMDEFSWLWQG